VTNNVDNPFSLFAHYFSLFWP